MKLSIITINRNNAEGLRKTIDSVVSQTYTGFEYIVIDGASTDNSVEIIKQYEDKISYWISEPDKGIYNAMNKGIFHTSGDYCLFLNSGDYLHDNDVLRKISEFNCSADICCFDANFVFSDGTIEKHTYPENPTFEFLYNSSFCHQSLLYRTDVLKQIGGYDESFKIVADWALNVLLLIEKNVSYVHYPLVMTDYNMEGISWSDNGRKLDREERSEFMQRHFPVRILEDYVRMKSIKSNSDFRRVNRIHHPLFKKVLSLCIKIIDKLDRII